MDTSLHQAGHGVSYLEIPINIATDFSMCNLKAGDWLVAKNPTSGQFDGIYREIYIFDRLHEHHNHIFYAHPVIVSRTPMTDPSKRSHQLYFDEWRKATDEEKAQIIAAKMQGKFKNDSFEYKIDYGGNITHKIDIRPLTFTLPSRTGRACNDHFQIYRLKSRCTPLNAAGSSVEVAALPSQSPEWSGPDIKEQSP